MKLEIIVPDPLNILGSTKRVVENSKFVELDNSKIFDLAKLVDQRIKQGLPDAAEGYAATGNYKNDVQLIFIEDTVNFCFWAEKDKNKWRIEYPEGRMTTGGFESFLNCFRRALVEGAPILETEYLASIKLEDVRKIFRGVDDIEIPLIDKRLENLKEAGQILLNKFKGHFINALEEVGYDAIELVKLIYQNFPSFRDISVFDNQEVVFLKRAQICPNDLSYLVPDKPSRALKNLDQLTVLADYKLPQILRAFEITRYSKDLAERVDNYILIPAGSREEIEIRAATIWAGELIRQNLGKYPAREIDYAIWLISQNLSKTIKPYHRTYTIYY